MSADSPELAAAKQLFDAAKDQGFRFSASHPALTAPYGGIRQTPEFLDELYPRWVLDTRLMHPYPAAPLRADRALRAAFTARVVVDALSEVGRRARFQRCAGPFPGGLLPNQT